MSVAMETRKRRSVTGRLLICCAGLLGACGHRHVSIENPATTPGSRYTCKSMDSCTPATVDVPARLNQSGTTFVALPRQCAGRIHKIVILNADSSTPEIDVTCAPIEAPAEPAGPIEEMQ
jgi:hypothetical protein